MCREGCEASGLSPGRVRVHPACSLLPSPCPEYASYDSALHQFGRRAQTIHCPQLKAVCSGLQASTYQQGLENESVAQDASNPSECIHIKTTQLSFHVSDQIAVSKSFLNTCHE